MTGLVDELLRRCRFPDRSAIDCAVSGGPDSLALLVLGCAAGHQVTAWHVDHGLRDGSAVEAGVVAAAATRLGASFRAVSVEIAPGPNLEARARAARFERLPEGVLTGHTADDQAETVLLALVRGAGLDGLAGMGVDGHPLLSLRRTETRALCTAVGLLPVDDPSNDSPQHRRNRIRHEVLPLLDDVAERDVAAVVARQCRLLADDAELLDDLAQAVDVTDVGALTGAPVALARRAIRRWLGDEHPPDAASVERVLTVARGGARATEVAGHRVWRSAGRLHRECIA